MPTVPNLNIPELPKRKSTMIVCIRGGKPLTPEDQKALDDFIQYRIDRAKKQKKPGVSKPASVLPHPYKCSKCEYVAPGRKESKQHWFDEHR